MKDLVPLLDKLGLTGIKTHLFEVMNLTDLQVDDKAYLVLKKLLEVECEYKKARSLNYRLRLAKLPTVKLLSETSQAKLVEQIDIKEVIDNHINILLIGGAYASGKSAQLSLIFLIV